MDSDEIRRLLTQSMLDWHNRERGHDVPIFEKWVGSNTNFWCTDWPDSVPGASAELARLVDDVQKNRNRGD
jgi:hypothetical protein